MLKPLIDVEAARVGSHGVVALAELAKRRGEWGWQMKHLVCHVDLDPTEWTEVEAWDAELAATLHAENLCSEDSECYRTFAAGAELLVKVEGGESRRFEVTMESVPHFSARPK